MKKNNNNLNELASVVRDNIEKDIDVLILRAIKDQVSEAENTNIIRYKNEPYEKLIIQLKPQKWSGAGYLG